MCLDLTDEEIRTLIKLVRRTIDEDRYPFSPWLEPLQALLAKLDPLAPQPEPLSPLKVGMRPNVGCGKQAVNRYSGPLMTLGSAISARVRLIVYVT
jgi:hypothetical protein